MTPPQVRAARGLLGMTQGDLADAARIGLSTLKRFEATGGTELRFAQATLLRDALEARGVVILPAGTVVDGRLLTDGVALVSRGGPD